MLPDVARRFRALEPAQRTRWVALPVIGLASAALEALAGALVFALVAVLLEPSETPAGIAGAVAGALPLTPGETPVVALAAWAAGTHVVRTVLSAAAAWWRTRMASLDAAALSARLLRGYLAAPWTFHLERRSAALIERLRDSVRPWFDVLESAAMIVADGALIAALGLVTLLAAPWEVSAMMIGLALPVAILLRLTRSAQLRGGARLAEHGAALYAHIQHGLGAIKELTILDRWQHVADAYERETKAAAALESRRALLQALPRLVVETAFVLGMLALVVAASRRGTLGAALPLVSLYAYAGFRVAPAAHRLALQIEQLRWSAGASSALLADLETHARQAEGRRRGPAARLEFRHTLRAEHVSFTYPRAAVPTLRDVTVEIRRGESVAIAGPTGAGKSTLVDVLLGLLVPDGGQVTVDGVAIASNLRGWQANVGYVPQAPFFLDDTLARNIALGVPDGEIDEGALRRAVTLARLDGLVARLPRGLDTRVGDAAMRLSGGERQRVAIARALYRQPALIVLDEATSALDADTERAVAEAIDALRGDRTLIVIAHRESTVRRCDRAIDLPQPSAFRPQPAPAAPS